MDKVTEAPRPTPPAPRRLILAWRDGQLRPVAAEDASLTMLQAVLLAPTEVAS
jgi:hypothetical protein